MAAAQHRRSTRYGYGAQQGAPGQYTARFPSLQTQFLLRGCAGTQERHQRRCGFDELGFAALHKDGRDSVRVLCCVSIVQFIEYTQSCGCGRAQGLDLVLQAGVFSRPCAVRGAAGREVRVVMVFDAAVGSRVLLRRGPASANAKTAPHRVLRETCGGGRTRAAPRAHELGKGGGRGCSRHVTCARRRDAVVRAPPSRRRRR